MALEDELHYNLTLAICPACEPKRPMLRDISMQLFKCIGCGFVITEEMYCKYGFIVTPQQAEVMMAQTKLLEAQWDYRKRAPSEFEVSDSGLLQSGGEMQVVGSEQSDHLVDFLDYLYEGLNGYVCSPTLDRHDDNPETNFRHHWFEWPAQRPDLINHIQGATSSLEVYLTPAMFAETKLSKDTFKFTNVVWTEFDGNAPSSLSNIPDPTLRIQSSNKGFEHWYWKLSSPCNDVTLVESINRNLTYQLGADASSWDATQILRPPNTKNHKHDGTTVRVKSRSETLTEISGFDSLPAIPEPEVAFSFDTDTIPDVTEVILKYAWQQQAITLFKTRDFPVGQRSTAIMQLGYFLAEMGMTDAEMFSVLRNADDRWGKFKDRKDRDKRLVDLISKARIKHPLIIEVSEDVIPIFGFQSLRNTEAEISWVIPGLLQMMGYMLLTGPSGVGKTQVSLQFAIHMALGKSFLGYEFERAYRLIFFSLEMGLTDLKYFINIMAEGLTDEECLKLEQNLLLIPLGEPMYLDSQPGQASFMNIIEQLRPDGVFIDSMGSTSTSELSSESTAKTLMDFNDRLRQKFNVFSWFIHHHRKATSDNKKPNKLSDVYGNQYLVNRATSVYCLWPGPGLIEVIPLKRRLAPTEENWQIVRTSNLNFFKKEKAFLQGTSHLTVVGDAYPNPTEKKADAPPLLDGI